MINFWFAETRCQLFPTIGLLFWDLPTSLWATGLWLDRDVWWMARVCWRYDPGSCLRVFQWDWGPDCMEEVSGHGCLRVCFHGYCLWDGTSLHSIPRI